MAMLLNSTKPYICAVGFSLVLSACGGGSDVVQDNTTPITDTVAVATPATPQGVETPAPAPAPAPAPESVNTPPSVNPNLVQAAFSAPAVSGLRYATATQSGTTDSNGEFLYLPNEAIVFSIGDIRFDSINAQNIQSLFELAQTHIISDTRYINMARLLYTLDADGNAENGIQISEITQSMAEGVTADFSSPNFDTQVANLVASSQNPNTVLIDIQQARNNITAQLDTDRSCARTSAKVGQVADLSTIDHDVSGRLRILNDCTIEVSQFFL